MEPRRVGVVVALTLAHHALDQVVAVPLDEAQLVGGSIRAGLEVPGLCDDCKDAGDRGAGHSVTAFCEIVPAEEGAEGGAIPRRSRRGRPRLSDGVHGAAGARADARVELAHDGKPIIRAARSWPRQLVIAKGSSIRTPSMTCPALKSSLRTHVKPAVEADFRMSASQNDTLWSRCRSIAPRMSAGRTSTTSSWRGPRCAAALVPAGWRASGSRRRTAPGAPGWTRPRDHSG